MTREKLVRKLADRKMASDGKNKIGCVPCFGRVLRVNTPRRQSGQKK
jgi:hypothetical protein